MSLLILVFSCGKDENPVSETDDEKDINDMTDSDDSETGAVTFEANFVLEENRTLVNQVLSQADYNSFISGSGDLKLVSQKVYEYFEDDFDFIIILSVEDTQPIGLDFAGRSELVQNQVQGLGFLGLGDEIFNNSTNFGSEEKLKNIIYMPLTEYIALGPFLHEIVHTWANKGFLPSTIPGHWGYSSVGGQLGGFDELMDLGNNNYRGKFNDVNGFSTNSNGANKAVYGNLELYLMGLIGADELETIQVAVNPVNGSALGEFSADNIQPYSAADLIDEHGPRVPSVENSQKDFKALTVVISTEAISQDKITQTNIDLENFSKNGNPSALWLNSDIKNFWLATQGKASLDFKVSQENIK